MTAKRIAITGGIGAGKSVVSRVVEAYGYPVYDCDSRAKAIMDRDLAMIRRIGCEIHTSAVNADGTLNRRALANIVFNDADKLLVLNSIVHAAVRADLQRWFAAHSSRYAYLFVESAILTESGLDAMVDAVWLVDAPIEVRIARVMCRNGLTRTEVEHRIASQSSDLPHNPNLTIIHNDDLHSLILQINPLLA